MSECEPWPQPRTAAAGLRVPQPGASRLVLDILRASGGGAVAVGDDEIFSAREHWARVEAILAALEGAASLAAYCKLLADGVLTPPQRVVLCNTGSGLKDLDPRSPGGRRADAPSRRSLGGIIQPY
jgi:threonine synthase